MQLHSWAGFDGLAAGVPVDGLVSSSNVCCSSVMLSSYWPALSCHCCCCCINASRDLRISITVPSLLACTF